MVGNMYSLFICLSLTIGHHQAVTVLDRAAAGNLAAAPTAFDFRRAVRRLYFGVAFRRWPEGDSALMKFVTFAGAEPARRRFRFAERLSAIEADSFNSLATIG